MTLAEIYNKQSNLNKSMPENNKLDIVVRMPEVAGLIKHLDLMYSKLLNNESNQREEQPMVEILGKPYIQTRSWFNPGQGIKQSEAVK